MRLDVEAARRAIERARRAARWASTLTRGGLGHPSSGQREHGGGRAHPRHRAGQGPARAIRSSPSAARGRCTPGRSGRILRVPRVLVPFGAGAASALRAPGRAARLRLRAHRARSASTPRTGRGVNRALRRDGGGRPRGAAPGGRGRRRRSRVRRSAEMRYVGQGHEVEVRVPAGAARAREPRRPSPRRSRPPTARSTAAPRSASPSRR